MALLPTIDEIPPATVTQLHAELSTILAERYPELDLSADGGLDGIVTHLNAVSGALQQVANEKHLAARSLLLATADPDAVDNSLVDLILANFRVTRQAGNFARGEVLLVLNQNTVTVVPSGVTFTANGLTFQTEADYAGRPIGATLLSERDRTMRPYPGDLFAFQVPVVAVAEGAGSNLKRSTRMTMSRAPGNVVQVLAATDFIGGRSEETNSEMVQRLETGIAARSWGGRVNIRALLMAQEEFELQALTIVGMNEPEQLRDRHGIIPLASGGKLDIYVKTASRPTSIVVEKTATCVEQSLAGSVWQVVVDPADAPGFYEAVEITDTVTGDFGTIQQDTRFSGSTDFDRDCDITDAVEVAYTAFQAASLRFETPTSLAVGTQRLFRLVLSIMPNIGALQTFCSGYDTGPPAADVLVRAAIPCEVSIGLKVYAPVGAVVDANSVGEAIAGYINNTGFIGQLSAVDVAYAAKNVLPSDHQIGEISMVGTIRAPDGTIVAASAADVLRVPSYPELLVTERTVAFVSEPTAIGVDVLVIRAP